MWSVLSAGLIIQLCRCSSNDMETKTSSLWSRSPSQGSRGGRATVPGRAEPPVCHMLPLPLQPSDGQAVPLPRPAQPPGVALFTSQPRGLSPARPAETHAAESPAPGATRAGGRGGRPHLSRSVPGLAVPRAGLLRLLSPRSPYRGTHGSQRHEVPAGSTGSHPFKLF